MLNSLLKLILHLLVLEALLQKELAFLCEHTLVLLSLLHETLTNVFEYFPDILEVAFLEFLCVFLTDLLIVLAFLEIVEFIHEDAFVSLLDGASIDVLGVEFPHITFPSLVKDFNKFCIEVY